jgi:SAM-dependent methyltransferase
MFLFLSKYFIPEICQVSDALPNKPESIDYKSLIKQQIERGILVCPATREKLIFGSSESLNTVDGSKSYLVLNDKIPILITDNDLVKEYAKSSQRMNKEYTEEHLKKQDKWFNRLRRYDYRTEDSVKAKSSIFDNLGPNAVCLSVGGGPMRADTRLLNLNIGPFPNVDIVGDAHNLPYADNSVDAIYCEAVFEHLHTPVLAANEIFRVLKKGGKAFICTPFLQAYHGFPHHYQNFTLTGHVNLFKEAGLQIIQSGACVGPTYVLRNMIAVYIATYVPFPINKILRILWAGISIIIAPLDILLGKKTNAHIMASTTYLVAEKI